MKTMVVGDLHGDLQLAVDAVNYCKNNDLNLIFIGDYLDSFTFGRDEQLSLINFILDTVENSDTVSALLGNHEYAYLKDSMRCSGFSKGFRYKLAYANILSRMKALLKDYIFNNGFLITHAGVSRFLITEWRAKNTVYSSDKSDLGVAYEILARASDCIYNIGYSRGGSSECGGIFWCDWWEEFLPVEGLNQIVGHTAFRPSKEKGIVSKGNNYNIDCLGPLYNRFTGKATPALDPEVLIIESGKAMTLKTHYLKS